MVERRNPFAAWAQPSPATAVSNLEKRAEMAARALEQAERDLAAARQRVPSDDDAEKKLAEWRRQGALAERERIRLILTSPAAARQTRLADVYAFETDTPAADAIAMMETASAAASQRSAKETSDLIVLAGRRARGELPCEVTAGPKVFVRMTSEEIISAAKKARAARTDETPPPINSCACLATPASAANLGGTTTWATAPSSTCSQAIHYLARTSGGNEGGNATNIGMLICGLVQDGVITGDLVTTGCGAPLDVLQVYAQQNQTDSQLNICGTNYTASASNGSVAYTAYKGFSGFNTAAAYYVNTGYDPGGTGTYNYTLDIGSIGIWSYAVIQEGTPQLSNSNTGNIYDDYTDGNFYGRVNNGATPGVPVPGTEGLFVADRSSSALTTPYWDGIAQAGQAGAPSGGISNSPFLVGSVNNSTVGSAQTISEFHAGGSLGATLEAALYNRLRTYMTAVGVP